MQLGTPDIISKSQRETNYAKYCFHVCGPVICVLSQHLFKRKTKE